MTKNQLTTLFHVARSLGHQWACILTLEEALDLVSSSAIDAVVRRAISHSSTPLGITCPDENGFHRFPSRGFYNVNSEGQLTITITRPEPGAGSCQSLIVKMDPDYPEEVEVEKTYPESASYLLCRSWHLEFVSNMLGAFPRAMEIVRAQALNLAIEEYDAMISAARDHEDFAREGLEIAIRRYRDAVIERFTCPRPRDPRTLPQFLEMHPPTPPWLSVDADAEVPA